MVTPERKRELAGVALVAFGALCAFALVPTGFLGTLGERWFPSGNVMGIVGGGFRRVTVYLFGLAAWALPAGIVLGGLHLGGWLERERVIRMLVLAAGLLLMVPTAAHVLPLPAGWAGWIGRTVGSPLRGALGTFGAGLLLAVLFVLLFLATLGWNPVKGPGLWLAARSREWVREGVDWLEGTRQARREAREGPEAGSQGGVGSESESGSPFGSGPTHTGPATGIPAATDPADPGAGGAMRHPPGGSAPPPSGPAPQAKGDGSLPDPRDPRELLGEELPPIELLTPAVYGNRSAMERDLDALGEVLVEKLRTFNVRCEIGGRTTGPVVTQFEVIPAPGVKVNRIANLDRDLALAMRAKTVRIVAPIPGKGAVGVEIPNPVPLTVPLREILESPAFRGSRAELPVALGKDLHGAPYVADLARMPHALIAGATGSGKSVCLNTVITSLVYRHTPETLRLLLIDPKMVELSTYGDLPHLRHPVVTDPRDAAGVLKWATLEMERRYALLSENGVRSIGEFNRRVRSGVPLRRVVPRGEEGDPDRWIYAEGVLPFVVLVVDELADLMMSVQSEVEKPLTLLAQKARAIGLHLIVATQRPSVNVITGLIKANFPCRMAFRVASKTDSRTILDQNGADALLGDGDMLFLPPGQSAPIRIQGAYISTEETERLIDWYRELRERKLAEEGLEGGAGGEEDILELVRQREAEDASTEEDPFEGNWDEYFREAAELCIRNDQGSTSLLQRKLRVGYGRAARIVDQLHDAGVLGPPDGSKPREVLMSLDQLERMFSDPDSGS
jgi:DNA segregation ATPase FtsK/SpoIIIE, S-DNA-T family